MKLIVAVLLNLLLALPALAASPVWEVKSGDFIAYLGGTCHALRASDFPLPATFDRAYRQSAVVVFEVDIDALESREFKQKVRTRLIYGDGRSLPDDISPKTYRSLERYCEKAGLQIAALNSMKPPLVMLTLLEVELQKLGITRAGVDDSYYGKAKADGKRMEALETADEQIGFLAALGKGRQDRLIQWFLADVNRLETMFEELIEVWRRGDGKKLYRLVVKPAREDFPELYQTLFVARNEKWLPRIEAFLATPERELVLVGAGHLVGPDGLIESLRKRGYVVRQLD